MPWPDLIQPVAPKDMQWATTRACWHCILSFFPVESQLRCRPPNSCSSLLVYLVPSQNAGTFHCKACFGIHWSLILNTWPSHWTVRPLTVADSRGSRTPIGLIASKMTYIVSGGALNSTHSLTHSYWPQAFPPLSSSHSPFNVSGSATVPLLCFPSSPKFIVL